MSASMVLRRLIRLPGFNLIGCQSKTGGEQRFSLHSRSRSLVLDLNHSSLGTHINYPTEAFDLLLTALPIKILVPLFLDRLLNGE
jgi:hypothetical protein